MCVICTCNQSALNEWTIRVLLFECVYTVDAMCFMYNYFSIGRFESLNILLSVRSFTCSINKIIIWYFSSIDFLSGLSAMYRVRIVCTQKNFYCECAMRLFRWNIIYGEGSYVFNFTSHTILEIRGTFMVHVNLLAFCQNQMLFLRKIIWLRRQ